MGIEVINNNSHLVRAWIDKEKRETEQYYKEHPDSLLPGFEEELRALGFVFESRNQIAGFMPKHKKSILPIAVKYYRLAREQQKDNEQNYFLSLFHFRGIEEVVPMLIEDFCSQGTSELTRWFIGDCLFQIRAKGYIEEYLRIIQNPKYGLNRQMIILLMGKLKVESAIPILVDLLEDEEVRLHAICALGDFKREEFRCHFERFMNVKHAGWRKHAKAALKKLNN